MRETKVYMLKRLNQLTTFESVNKSLRFCSNFTGPGPSIFYLPAPQPDEIPLSNERDKSLYAKTFESVIKGTAEENFEIET